MTSTVAAATTRPTRNVDTTDPMLTGTSEGADTQPMTDYGWGTGAASRESVGAGPQTAPPPPPVPPSGVNGPPPPDGRSRRRPLSVAAVAVVSALVSAAVAALFIRIPYDSVAPGSANRVDDLISITGHEAYPPKGRLLFTTVSVRERINLWEAFAGWLDSDVDVVSEEDIRGPVPPDEYHQLNVEAMADSKTSAEAIVLGHMGYTDIGAGAEVVSIEPALPVASVLKPKDLIVGADGKPVKGPTDVIDVIRSHKPGDPVTLSIVRGDAPPVDVSTTLGAGENGQALLGVRLSTRIKAPFGIAIDSGNIEGPSAGVAYSLALLDQLTPGELTGGAVVAATGELASDGTVGPIGGITQKVAAVKREGATVFLVPKVNYTEAEARAGSELEVIPVATFDDALRALAKLPGSNAGDFLRVGAGGG
ncbi:MAG: PDZ domain-containing protein [Actinobacteria bacterium]|nr:PDZ domain-containing protein [Actinomycetota bacterium]